MCVHAQTWLDCSIWEGAGCSHSVAHTKTHTHTHTLPVACFILQISHRFIKQRTLMHAGNMTHAMAMACRVKDESWVASRWSLGMCV